MAGEIADSHMFVLPESEHLQGNGEDVCVKGWADIGDTGVAVVCMGYDGDVDWLCCRLPGEGAPGIRGNVIGGRLLWSPMMAAARSAEADAVAGVARGSAERKRNKKGCS